VRGRDDDAIGKMSRAIAVVDEDGPGNDRSWCEAVVCLDDGFDVVRRQDFERRALCRRRKRVRVLAQVERTIGPLIAAVVADGLRNGQDVRLGERAVQGRAAVAAGTECNQLVRIRRVRRTGVVLAFETREIDESILRSRLPGQW